MVRFGHVSSLFPWKRMRWVRICPQNWRAALVCGENGWFPFSSLCRTRFSSHNLKSMHFWYIQHILGIVGNCLIYRSWEFHVSSWSHWRDITWDAYALDVTMHYFKNRQYCSNHRHGQEKLHHFYPYRRSLRKGSQTSVALWDSATHALWPFHR